MTAKVSSLGGNMYGDGEYIVSFHNVGSSWAPLKAHVMCPSGASYEVGLRDVKRPSVSAATEVIRSVKKKEEA